MMIHVEHTSLTCRAMMASFLYLELPLRLETMTEETVSSFAILRLLCEEAPVNWYTAWVTDYRFKLTP